MKNVYEIVRSVSLLVLFVSVIGCDSGGGDSDEGGSEATPASTSSSQSSSSSGGNDDKAASCSPKVSVSISSDKSVAMMTGSCLPKGGMAELQTIFPDSGSSGESAQGTVGSDGLISLSVPINAPAGDTKIIVDGRVELITDEVARQEKTFNL